MRSTDTNSLMSSYDTKEDTVALEEPGDQRDHFGRALSGTLYNKCLNFLRVVTDRVTVIYPIHQF